MSNILVFSPHPDDAELVIGGLIKKLSNRHNIQIVYLTNGDHSCGDSIEARKEESIKACSELSVKKHIFMDFGDLCISRSSVIQQERIIDLIRQYKPQLILSPHFSDSNVDHIVL